MIREGFIIVKHTASIKPLTSLSLKPFQPPDHCGFYWPIHSVFRWTVSCCAFLLTSPWMNWKNLVMSQNLLFQNHAYSSFLVKRVARLFSMFQYVSFLPQLQKNSVISNFRDCSMLLKTGFSHLDMNFQSKFCIVKNLTGLLAESLWHLWHEACPKK